MQITLSFDSFTELPYTSGTIQNISSQATVEICQDDTANTGLILGPGEWFSWSNSTIYARSAWDYEPTATCAVVPFKDVAGGGGSSYTLPVATESTLGGVKSSNVEGKISVDEITGVMTFNEPTPSVNPLTAPDWVTGTSYPVNALVRHETSFYMCLTAHTASTFADDLENGYWKQVDSATTVINDGQYIQSTQMGVTGSSATPAEILLPINNTSTFCLPPIEILEIKAGATDQIVNAYAMSSSDAADFSYDNDYVEFDGTMHLKTTYNLTMSNSEVLNDGYERESDLINIDEFRVIESINLSSISSELLALNHFDNSLNADYGPTNFTTSETVNYESDGDFGYAVKVNPPRPLESTNTLRLSEYENWTVEMRFKCNGSYTNDNTFIFVQNGSYVSLGFYIINSTTLRLEHRDSSGNRVIENVSVNYNDNTWHHLAIVYNGTSEDVFYDGTKIISHNNSNGVWGDPSTTSLWIIGAWGNSRPGGSYIDIDEFAVWSKAKYNSNFTPNSFPYNASAKTLYKDSSNAVYGFNNGDFEQVVTDWNVLSANDKVSAFNDYGNGNITAQNISSINDDFSVIVYLSMNNDITAQMTAVPDTQIVIPNGLIPLSNYAALTSVAATVNTSDNGAVKMAVTADLTTYYTYDIGTSAWVTIATSNIPTDGMTATQLAAVPAAAWASLDATDLGIAYSLYQSASTDTAEVDALTLSVTMAGEMESQVQGTDYDYSYASNTILKVKLYKNGDFKINYSPGV